MYLGLTDGGNSQTGDWNAISSHPRYSEFEHLWLDYDGYADDVVSEPAYLLPQPIVIEGISYPWVWLTSNGNIYFSEENENGPWYPSSSDYTPSPGQYGKPSLMPMVSDKICNYAGVRRSPDTLTIRYQAATYDNFDALDGIASVIWETTFYKPDPEIDADLQFIQFKCSLFDPDRDAQLIEGQVDWSPLFLFGGVNNGQRLLEFPVGKPSADAPASWVITGDPDGQIWNFQADRFIESPCDFIPQSQTIAHGHHVIARSAIQRTVVAHGHSAAPQPTVNVRTFTYNRTSSSARLLPADRLQGMWPLFMFAHETDRSSTYGSYIGSGTEQGEPYWKSYWNPSNNSSIPNHTPSYRSNRRYSHWHGGSNVSYPLDEAGKLYTNQSTGESYRNFFFVFGGNAPWIWRNEHGMPYRWQRGRFMACITLSGNRDYDVYSPYVSRDSSSSPQYTILRWPQPATGEAKNPETGTYIYSRATMPAWKEGGNGYTNDGSLAQPFQHGLGKTPTWGIIWWGYSQSYWPQNSYVVYFNEDKVEAGNQFDPNRPYNDGAWKFMNSFWSVETQNRHRTNDHWKSENYIVNADREKIWVNLDIDDNQSDQHPRLNLINPYGGLTYYLFTDDAEACVTRYMPVGNLDVLDTIEVFTGWRPDVVWTWPYGEQGWQYTDKMIIVAPQEGDEREGDIYAHDICETSVRRYTDPDAWVRDNRQRWEYQLHDQGIRFRRLQNWEDGYEPSAAAYRFPEDYKMFFCLQRQAPVSNTGVGQFFLNGYADFTYTGAPGYLSEPGEFVITGQELLKDDGVLPYPPPLLEGGEFQIIGQEIGYTYIRWLRLRAETGEFELGGQVAQLIFCCYPDLIGQPTIYTFTGYDAGYTLARHLDCERGEFLLGSGDTVLDYDRWLWIYPETGEFQLNGYATFNWVRRVFPETGEFNLTGFDAELAIKNGTLRAEAGEFLLTGFDGIALRDPLKAEAGSFELTGGDAGQQLGDYPFFELEAGAFYLGGGFIEFRRDLRIFSVGYGSFNTFGQAAGLNHHRVLSASVGQFQLNGFAGLGPAMVAEAGEFNLEGAEAGRNTPAYVLVGGTGQFVLGGQETGGDVTIVPPLVAEAGAFVLTGSGTTPENEFPGPFPNKVHVGWHTSYTATAPPEERVINTMPHDPSWVQSFPTEFPLNLRDLRSNLGGTSGVWGSGNWRLYTNGLNDWIVSRIAGRNRTTAFTDQCLSSRNQPSLLKGWLTNGVVLGDASSTDAGSNNPTDVYNAAYNYTTPEVLINADPADLGVSLSYILFSISIDHPSIKGEDLTPLEGTSEAGGYEMRQPHPVDEYKEPKLYIRPPDEFFDENGNVDTQLRRADATWITGTPEEFDAIALKQHEEAGDPDFPDSWIHHNRGKTGRYWSFTDQTHGGIAMGGMIMAAVNWLYSRPSAPQYEEENVTLMEIEHGLDSTPELLMLIPVRHQSYSSYERMVGSALWFKPEWGNEGARLQKAMLPTSLHYNPPSTQLEPDYDSYNTEPYRWSQESFWDFNSPTTFRIPGDGYAKGTNNDPPPEEEKNTAEPEQMWLAFKTVPGYLKVGTYSGDGTAPLWVPCAFRPAFVWIKATAGTPTGLYVHHRPVDPYLNGQTKYQLIDGYYVYDTNQGHTADTWPAFAPAANGPESLTFTAGGFYVPPGGVGNKGDGQEVTFVSFAVEHMRIQRMASGAGAFEIQGQEIGGHKPNIIHFAEAGEFMVCNSCEAQLIVTRPNANPRRLIAEPTVFSLRGGFAWGTELLLHAEAGTFEISGYGQLFLPLRSFTPAPGAFLLKGQQANLREHRLVAESGRFFANLQWAGGSKPIEVECRVGPKPASDESWEFAAGREPIQGTGTAARTDKQGRTWTQIAEGDYTGMTYSRRYAYNSYARRFFPYSTSSTTYDYRLGLVSGGYICFDYYSDYDYTLFNSANPRYSTLFLFAGNQTGSSNTPRRNRQYEFRNYSTQVFRGVEDMDVMSYRWESSLYENSGQLGNSDWVIEVHVINNWRNEYFSDYYNYYGKVFIEVRLGRYLPSPYANGDPTRVPGIGLTGEYSPIEDFITGQISEMEGPLFSEPRADRVYLFEIQGSQDSYISREEARWTLHVGKEFGLSCDVVMQAEGGGFELTGSESLYLDRPREILEVGHFVTRGGRNPIFTVSKLAGILQAYEGNFSLSGGEAGGSRSLRMSAGAGAFLMNGRASGGLFEQVLRAETGVVALSGGEANFLVEAGLEAEAGAFLLSAGATELIYRRQLRLQTNVGNYDLFGQAATFSRARTWSVEAGSFVLNGRQAGSINDQVVRGWAGSFQLEGQDVGGKKTAIVLDAGPDEVIELQGQDAELRYFRAFDPSVAQFLLTGFESEGLYSRRTVAGSGAFALGGGGATFTYTRKITFGAEAGSFQLGGQVASYRQDQLIGGGAGAFSLSGQAAGLSRHQVLMSSVAQYLLNGQDAQFIYVRRVVMPAETGSFQLGGQEARLRVLGNTKLIGGVGSFQLNGQDSSGQQRIALEAEAGAFALNGEAAGEKQTYRLSAESGAFELDGQDVVGEFVRVLSAMAGAFQLIGRAAGYIQDQQIGANNGVILLSGGEAQFTYYRKLKFEVAAGAFVLTGQDSEGLFEEGGAEYLSSWSRQNYGPLTDARVDGWAGSET